MGKGAGSEREWNRRIVEEFRPNGGRVGGLFESEPMLLLHHTGARPRDDPGPERGLCCVGFVDRLRAASRASLVAG